MGIKLTEKKAAAIPANETSQIDLLYRDIFIQMQELRELRGAIEEIKQLAEANSYSEELQEVLRIIEKRTKKG